MATCDAYGDETAGAGLQLAVLAPTAKSWPTGRASIGAIALAIEAVNDKAASLGEERKIAYRWAEVDCNRPQAIAALTRMLEEGPIDAVIGPHCSLTCESTAFLTAGRGIPQVSYSCSSPELSSKATFPTVRLRFARSFAGTFAGRCGATLLFAVCSHHVELHQLGACDRRVCALVEMVTDRDRLQHRVSLLDGCRAACARDGEG